MTPPAKANASPDSPLDPLELTAGLAAIVAAVLWSCALVLAASAPELCSSQTGIAGHCGLCLPAAASSLLALVSAGLWLRRRAAR